MKCVYALFKMENGGYGFEVLSKQDCIRHAERYSPGMNSNYSPWKSDFEAMCKKKRFLNLRHCKQMHFGQLLVMKRLRRSWR